MGGPGDRPPPPPPPPPWTKHRGFFFNLNTKLLYLCCVKIDEKLSALPLDPALPTWSAPLPLANPLSVPVRDGFHPRLV